MKNTNRIPQGSVLRRIQFYFRMLSQSSSQYLYATDLELNMVMVSPNMVQEFGLPGQIFANMDEKWIPLIHPDDKQAFIDNMATIKNTEERIHDLKYRVKNKAGNYIWLHCRGQIAVDKKNNNRPFLFAGVISQLGQENQADMLTGLLNKHQFEVEVKKILQRDLPQGNTGAIMFLGLDNFKIINESFNRRVGDILLKIAVDMIMLALPPQTTLYKLDGDVFAIIVPKLTGEESNKLFGDIQTSFCRPHNIEKNTVFCTLSAGTVVYPQGGKDYWVLYKHAEAALDLAKNDGKNKNCVFNKEIYNRWMRSVSMVNYLQDSIKNEFAGFSLYYQPQVDARTHHLVGVEALLRWRNPKGKMVAPGEFIAILEKTKLIIPVGHWILETAIKQCKAWQLRQPGIRMSINLSYEQIKDAGFKDFALACLAKYDLPPYLIVFELTETMIVSDWNNLNRLFEEFRQLGIGIAMDDFGTGYSSLAYLKNLACDIVKIDRAFVNSLTNLENEFDRRLVSYTIELCHSVGIHCCMEGVEQTQEYELLRDICHADTIQGYLFGRPEPPEVFETKYFEGEYE